MLLTQKEVTRIGTRRNREKFERYSPKIHAMTKYIN